MSLSVPSRRLIRSAPALTATPTSSLLPALQSLSLSPNTNNTPSARPIHTTPSNQWFWNRKSAKSTSESALESQVTGSQETRKALAAPTDAAAADRPKGAYTRAGASLVREHLARAVDPDPRSRIRWERKMVIRQVRSGTDPFSREPRAARIARTERQMTTKSPFLATSTKKLVKLAHQIQGKTVAEALVQMRFSKKKMAQEVRYQLELARDLAVAERGMGLGAKRALAAEGEGEGEASGIQANGETVEIQTKDGKWVKIDDPTRMYVAEAWVNRGPWRGKVPDYRARGRVNIKHRPTTSISIVLKEEKTRLREHAERQAQKIRQGPWVHLPDRPVTAQRQWYSW
ncbi:hypothetical protein NEMBOFW57_009126 [Staphylotrichum longicolle]|uniref:Mitochondrial large ribosomal subunit n=1 Tax=Staphylotrichum longicolle TaxID=669026 RepID=A0AAD4ET32_9PEZI|nr:hypothetical protein NEMBOFW57_009126 [Staphylotrichum longicolle]